MSRCEASVALLGDGLECSLDEGHPGLHSHPFGWEEHILWRYSGPYEHEAKP